MDLAELGRDLARQVARRYRLLESFLITALGYTWDEEHEESDVLEHACTDRFVARLDAHLDYPTRDSHVDPIPRADGTTDPLSAITLAGIETGITVIMEQVNDSDLELLRFLAAHNMRPGSKTEVTGRAFEGRNVESRHHEVPATGCCLG